MTYTNEHLIAVNKANVQTLEELTIRVYAGIEQLIDLNLAASKDASAFSFNHAQSVLGAKDPQELQALQAGLYSPLVEKSIAYCHHLYTLATGARADFNRTFESRLADAKTAFTEVVGNLSKNSPVPTESAVAVFMNAVNVSQNVIETAQNSAKQAAEVAESGFTEVANQAVNVTTLASRIR
jgi:phasin family protein